MFSHGLLANAVVIARLIPCRSWCCLARNQKRRHWKTGRYRHCAYTVYIHLACQYYINSRCVCMCALVWSRRRAVNCLTKFSAAAKETGIFLIPSHCKGERPIMRHRTHTNTHQKRHESCVIGWPGQSFRLGFSSSERTFHNLRYICVLLYINTPNIGVHRGKTERWKPLAHINALLYVIPKLGIKKTWALVPRNDEV